MVNVDAELHPAPEDSHYELHLAAVEHDLGRTILVNSRDDLLSRNHWQDKMKPFEHQVRNLLTFCRRAPVMLIADEVGLGKTVSAGLILSELRARARVERCLVICPKILMPQWKGELSNLFGIEAHYEAGKGVIDAAQEDHPVLITTYHSAKVLLNHLKEIGQPDRFGMLILDEAHRLKNLFPRGAKPPQNAMAIQTALEEGRFEYVLMLTATPIQRRYSDIYSLVHCLATAKGHVNPFGDWADFRKNYIADAELRKLRPGVGGELRDRVADYVVRSRRADLQLPFPERKVELVAVTPTEPERALHELLGAAPLAPLLKVSLARALTSSPEALECQVRNMLTRGTLDRAVGRALLENISRIESPSKLKRLLELAEPLKSGDANFKLLVFAERRATVRMLRSTLHEAGHRSVGLLDTEADATMADLRAFRDQNSNMRILISSQVGTEGVNLQVASKLVNYDLPWNPMVVEQRIGRIQRLGSQHAGVEVINLCTRDTVEERVVGRILESLLAVTSVVGDIESILGVGGLDEDKLEKKIETLVLRAFDKVDVNEGLAAIRRDIEKAKALYVDEKRLVDETFGRLERMHAGGSALVLEKTRPRLGDVEFLRKALEVDGYVVELGPEGLLVRNTASPASIETISYQTSGLERGRLRNYVNRWLPVHLHRVRDLRPVSPGDLEEVIRQWFIKATDGCVVRSCLVGDVLGNRFAGEVVLRATANVARDRYEKLVVVRHNSEWTGTVEASTPTGPSEWVKERISPAQLQIRGEDHRQQVEQDQDVRQFCDFYQKRLAEELERFGTDRRMQQKIREWFTPRVEATPVAISGALLSEVEVVVRFSTEDHDLEGKHEAVFRVLTGAPMISLAPSVRACEETWMRVPEVALELCSVSKKRVLKQLLGCSEESGRLALARDFFEQCAVTLKWVLKEELRHSDVPPRRKVLRRLLYKSQISKRKGLESERFLCDITGVVVLEDELVLSQASGLWFRKDEARTSAKSGMVAHKSEGKVCAVTGEWALLSEMGVSDFSGQMAINDKLVTCEETGRILLPQEAGPCSISGKLVDNRELVTSAVSGDRFLPRLGKRSARSNQWARPEEMISCWWTWHKLLPSETRTCEWTGLAFDEQHMFGDILRPLRGLVQGDGANGDDWEDVPLGLDDEQEIIDALAIEGFPGARHPHARASLFVPEVWAVVARQGGMLGLGGRRLAFLVVREHGAVEVVSRVHVVP